MTTINAPITLVNGITNEPLTRDVKGLKVRLADVYRKPGQTLAGPDGIMAELKTLTDADLADFTRWFEAAGYPITGATA